MRRALLAVPLLVLGLRGVHADSWACPEESDCFSDNKLFVGHVTAAKEGKQPRLEVFAIKDSKRVSLWSSVLGNEGGPQEVFISDDGKYAVTINECNRTVHGGFGDYVIAFYNGKGVIRNYSLEEILHYPDQIDKRRFDRLVTRSVSGRSWTYRPMFFDQHGRKLCFCLWLLHGEQWLAWDVASGTEIEVDDTLAERWGKKARRWALASISHRQHWGLAAEFLARLRRPEDRPAIQTLLAGDDFHTYRQSRLKGKKREFAHYYTWSTRRTTAERILGDWDGKPVGRRGRFDQSYRFLGVVAGSVTLLRPPRDGDHWLCTYLLPENTERDKWHAQVPVHRFTAHFWKYAFHNTAWPGSEIAFQMRGVTPGAYRVKAVWDRAKPYNFGSDYITGPPQAGDLESTGWPRVTVKAGETVDGLQIDCTHEVNGTAPR